MSDQIPVCPKCGSPCTDEGPNQNYCCDVCGIKWFATPVDDVQKRVDVERCVRVILGRFVQAPIQKGLIVWATGKLAPLLTRIEELEKEVSKRLSPEASKNIVVELGERNKTIEELSAKLAEAEKDKERLAKLAEYAEHGPNCPKRGPIAFVVTATCDCGLDAASKPV